MPTTARHAIPSPASTAVPDVPVDIKAANDAIDLKLPYVTTSTPTATSGLIWRNSTTGAVVMGDGSAFFPFPGSIVGSKLRTTNATATSGTTESSFLDHTFNLIASSSFKVEVFAPWTPDNVGDLYVFRIRQTSVAGTLVVQETERKVEGILPYSAYLSAIYRTTSAEATKVFHATAARIGSGGTCRPDAGTFMVVTYLGPSSQTATV